MKLAELLDGCVSETTIDNKNPIKGIALDSRKIKAGYVFLAVAGAQQHGLEYAGQAIENGAIAIVYDRIGSEKYLHNEVKIELIPVDKLAEKLGIIASHFFHSPSSKLDVIGVTGTNGKTSCSQFLLQLVPESGVIGTLGWGDKETLKQTLNTTPDALAVQQMLMEFVCLKKKAVVMEVSSHGLQQGRVNGVSFKGAVFINLSRDHLDYHGSMEVYLQAKLLLFKQEDLQFVAVNTDDSNSERFLSVVNKDVKQWAFSVTGNTISQLENVWAEEVDFSLNGIKFTVCWQQQRIKVQTRIVGGFNLENILAAMTVLLAQGYPLNECVEKVAELVPVEGRMERWGGDEKPFVFIDYAHTPDALKKVLTGLRAYCKNRLMLVFGCGGDRDQGKRPQMGAIAENYADYVMITNDNPRFENEDIIINDILAGCTQQVGASANKIEIMKDRGQAIQAVIKKAAINDCVVIAGKGHEKYQEIGGVKNLFSDQEVVKKALQDWRELA